jgi:hypothetical protein
MTFVGDLSFAWPTLTGSVLTKLGASGVIGYAGCFNTSKNVSKARFDDWGAHGLARGLVIENGEHDLAKGAATGAAQGAAIVAAAKALGYDWQNSVLFTGADFNEGPGDYANTLAGFTAFAERVPLPGYYGDSDSIDNLYQRFPHAIYWQSDSDSFSPEHPSPHAHLWQRYNDPRAKGLAVDVNEIRRTPLRLMGEDMALDPTDPVVLALRAQIAAIPAAVIAQGVKNDASGLVQSLGDRIVDIEARETEFHNAEVTLLNALQLALANVTAGQVDVPTLIQQLLAAGLPEQLAQDLAAHLVLSAK